MLTLVFNAGSSSLRFALFDEKNNELYRAHIDAIGQLHCKFRRYFKDGKEKQKKIIVKNHKAAIQYALKRLQKDGIVKELRDIKKVGHRIVHGGEEFTKPTKLTALTIRKIAKLNSLAPQHNPVGLEAVRASKKLLLQAKHYAIFDTAFHASLPSKAYLYGIPYKLYKKDHIRRYGFHGISHKYVSVEAAKLLKKPSASVITCHMGNGISIAAIKNKTCLDTSMGFTPLEGPIMGTRSGSIDPAIIFHLMNGTKGKDMVKKLEKLHHMLEKESGFKGLSGISSDMRKLRAKHSSAGAMRVFDVLSYQMAKTILSYIAPLGNTPDAIVFTAGIGEHAWYLRQQICEYLKPIGVKLDPKKNRSSETQISNPRSKIKVLVLKANEELQIAKEI